MAEGERGLTAGQAGPSVGQLESPRHVLKPNVRMPYLSLCGPRHVPVHVCVGWEI